MWIRLIYNILSRLQLCNIQIVKVKSRAIVKWVLSKNNDTSVKNMWKSDIFITIESVRFVFIFFSDH